MKTTLTKDDPAGWYLCEFWGRTYVRWWDGENFLRRPNGIRYGTWDANPWVWVATFKKVEAAQ